jgi:hypothetical protein
VEVLVSLQTWNGEGQHQVVGGASLELRRGRKDEYLDIPMKDSVGGLRLPKILKNTTNMFSKYDTFIGTFGLGMKLYTIRKAWSGRRLNQF